MAGVQWPQVSKEGIRYVGNFHRRLVFVFPMPMENIRLEPQSASSITEHALH